MVLGHRSDVAVGSRSPWPALTRTEAGAAALDEVVEQGRAGAVAGQGRAEVVVPGVLQQGPCLDVVLAVVENGARGRARGAGRDAATARSRSWAWPAAARGRRRGGFGGVDDAALIGVRATEAEGAMQVPGRGACSPGDGGGAPGSQGARAWSMEARQGLGEEGASHGLVAGRGRAHQQWRRLGNGGEQRLGLLYAPWPRVPGGADHPRRPCPQWDTRRWMRARVVRNRGCGARGRSPSCRDGDGLGSGQLLPRVGGGAIGLEGELGCGGCLGRDEASLCARGPWSKGGSWAGWSRGPKGEKDGRGGRPGLYRKGEEKRKS